MSPTEAELRLKVVELQNDLAEAKLALRANQVFHTPVALRRKPDRQWDEYEMDAIKRTKAVLGG